MNRNEKAIFKIVMGRDPKPDDSIEIIDRDSGDDTNEKSGPASVCNDPQFHSPTRQVKGGHHDQLYNQQ